MFGLIVLTVLLAYLALLIWTTRRGFRWGIENRGWHGRKRYLGAALGFSIVALPVFWDWLPVIAVHHYYCRNNAGFFVYKTLDQWMRENPGVAETLTPYGKTINDLPSERIHNGQVNARTIMKYNALIARDYIISERSFIPVRKKSIQIIDISNDEILAEYIDFDSGHGNPMTIGGINSWKFWLQANSCFPSTETNVVKDLITFSDSVLAMGSK